MTYRLQKGASFEQFEQIPQWMHPLFPSLHPQMISLSSDLLVVGKFKFVHLDPNSVQLEQWEHFLVFPYTKR